MTHVFDLNKPSHLIANDVLRQLEILMSGSGLHVTFGAQAHDLIEGLVAQYQDKLMPLTLEQAQSKQERDEIEQEKWLRNRLKALIEPVQRPEPPIVGILKRFVRARVQAGLSQSQAAKLIGLSAGSTISHYESGARELSVMTLLELCKIYDVSLVWVMTGVNPHFTDEQRQQVIEHWQKNVNLAVDDLHKTLDLLESLRQE